MGKKTRDVGRQHRKDLQAFPGDSSKVAIQKMREEARKLGWKLKHLARKGVPDVWMNMPSITLGGDVPEEVYADALPKIKAEGGTGVMVRVYGTEEQIKKIAERVFEACPDYEFKAEAGFVEDLEPRNKPKEYLFFCVNRMENRIVLGRSSVPDVKLDPEEFDPGRVMVFEVPDGEDPEEALENLRKFINSQSGLLEILPPLL